ncbi:MAG: TPM domain-containing protein [Candidatus Diapherotrites archaeon]|nr:TPM domain-containing protein [Candidatus Diapherotrites archaeon]
MNKTAVLFFLFGSFALFSSVAAVSLDQMPTPQGYVTDLTDVLSAEQKATLESRLGQIDANTTVEIAIAIVDSTGTMPIEMFANSLGNKWKVGKTDVFNGVMVVIAVDDRRYFIATAKGIEGTLPDLVTHDIGEQDLVPYFREGDYFSGLSAMADDLGGYAQQDPTIVSKYSGSSSGMDDATGFFALFGLFWVLFIGLPIITGLVRAFHLPVLGVVALVDITVIMVCWFLGVGDFFVLGFLLVLFSVLTIAFSSVGGAGGTGGGWSSTGGFHSSSGSRGSHSFGGGGGFSGGGSGGSW